MKTIDGNQSLSSSGISRRAKSMVLLQDSVTTGQTARRPTTALHCMNFSFEHQSRTDFAMYSLTSGSEILSLGIGSVVNGYFLQFEHFEGLLRSFKSVISASIPVHDEESGLLELLAMFTNILPSRV